MTTKVGYVVIDLDNDVDGQVDDIVDVTDIATKYGTQDKLEDARENAMRDLTADGGRYEIWRVTAVKVEEISRER